MTDMPSGPPLPPHSGRRLILSSDETFEREKREEEERAAQRRAYWRRYSQRKRRVYGMLDAADYAKVAARAFDAQGENPSVWRQIWAESAAYAENAVLPTAEIAALQRELLEELRRIGDAAEQLARQGALRTDADGMPIANEGDALGADAATWFETLEAKVCAFSTILQRCVAGPSTE